MTPEENKEQAVTTPALPPAVPPQEDEMDFSPIIAYLQSPQGHEIASRVVGLIEGVKKATIDKSYSQAKFNRWMEVSVMIVVIGAIVGLSFADKLNPTVSVLLGSVVGYFFGKNK